MVTIIFLVRALDRRGERTGAPQEAEVDPALKVAARCRPGEIFLVGDMLHPGDRRAVQRFLDGDVGHALARRGAVPMLVLGRAPENVAGMEFEDRSVLDLGPAHAL